LAVQKQELEAIATEYEKRKIGQMKYTALARWRKRMSLIDAEERVLLLKEQKLVARSWETWRTAT
jgi:hypothetical protein